MKFIKKIEPLKFVKPAMVVATVCLSGMTQANDQLETTGDILQFGIPVAAGMISMAKDDYDGLYELVEGAILTSAATHIMKVGFNETRPNGGDHSFPSGHTSAATQGAAYLQFRYGWEYGLPAYMAAGVVGYSRVESDHHYWRDVVAGAALATGIQYVITEMGFSVTDFAVTPSIGEKSVGVYASVSF